MFNRDNLYMPDGSPFNVTIYLKGGPVMADWGPDKLFPDSNKTRTVSGIQVRIARSQITLYSTVMPLLLLNINV